MDPLLKVALAGTARGGDRTAATGTPVDPLLAGLPSGSPERWLLLAAGARAVYRRAGRGARLIADAPEAASAEHLPLCSPAAARLVGEMLAGQGLDLLPEALELLRRGGRRLPPDLLPATLDLGARWPDQRPALLAVTGERGRWLGYFNPDWGWAADPLTATDDPLPADAERIWQEGTPDRRLALLRRLRAGDPARARDWLADVWKREKVEFRAAALGALAIGLAPPDELFLEAALDDRGQEVRRRAADLLGSLPGSTLARRMRERADALLSWEAPARGGAGDGRLVVTLPNAIDRDWQRDEPGGPASDRAAWLARALGLVPLTHWEERFGARPAELIAAADRDEAWEPTVLEGWTRAAVAARSAAWAAPLWDWWSRVGTLDAAGTRYKVARLRELIGCLPPDRAEQLAEELLVDTARMADHEWLTVLDGLPTPWSAAFGDRYLAMLRERVRRLPAPTGDLWHQTLGYAARGLPPACFDAALQARDLPAVPDWQIHEWRRRLDQFIGTIRTRQRLQGLSEEIAQ